MLKMEFVIQIMFLTFIIFLLPPLSSATCSEQTNSIFNKTSAGNRICAALFRDSDCNELVQKVDSGETDPQFNAHNVNLNYQSA